MRKRLAYPHLTTADRLFAFVGIVAAVVPLAAWGVSHV